jgi:hypothetical protein
MDQRERLAGIAAFIPQIEDPDLEIGKLVTGQTADGIPHLPFYAYGPAVSALLDAFNYFDWVVPFDWPSWAQTDEAQMYVRHPETILTCSIGDLERIITTLVRRERFSNGSLSAAIDSGMVINALRRAETLCFEERGDGV